MKHLAASALATGCYLFGSSVCLAATLFQGLGDLEGGGFTSEAHDVSSDGLVVVGSSSSVDGIEAFRWTRTDGMSGLGDLPGSSFFSVATAVSADGSVIVGRSSGTPNRGFPASSAFRWTLPQGMVELGTQAANGVSADGSIVVGKSGLPFNNDERSVRWITNSSQVITGPRSEATDLSANGSVIVGWTNLSGGISLEITHAYRWSSGVRTLLPSIPPATPRSNQSWAVADAISADGSVVVGASGRYQAPPQAVWWDAAGALDLSGDSPEGGFGSSASEVSGDGSIILGQGTTASGQEPFIWDSIHGMRSLRSLLIDEHGVDLSNWTLKDVTGISEDGLHRWEWH